MGSVAFLLAAAAVGVATCGARRWIDGTLELIVKLSATRLDANANAPLPARYDPRELDGLPASVQRYFRAVLTAGQPVISAATIELAGMFKLSAAGEQWEPFPSRQRVMTRRPGFLWGARWQCCPA